MPERSSQVYEIDDGCEYKARAPPLESPTASSTIARYLAPFTLDVAQEEERREPFAYRFQAPDGFKQVESAHQPRPWNLRITSLQSESAQQSRPFSISRPSSGTCTRFRLRKRVRTQTWTCADTRAQAHTRAHAHTNTHKHARTHTAVGARNLCPPPSAGAPRVRRTPSTARSPPPAYAF